ncbi:hemin uptake protein HemP [Zoogloeaceae bacteirum Par-f-2]|nr:hemin uptake protein HemP [Zoogloeaceae bacteirum Par-f-2]
MEQRLKHDRTNALDAAFDLPETASMRPGEQPIPSDLLLQGRSCVMIRHGDALYALRATRAGKLILTK